MAVLTTRNPLSYDEVKNYLDEKVNCEAAHWGEDYIYTRWAREARDKKLEAFSRGEVIPVHTEEYNDKYGNGTGSYSDTLFSDGHVETTCYGYLD